MHTRPVAKSRKPRVMARPLPVKAVRPEARPIRPALFYGLFALLLATNVVTALALLMTPDVVGMLDGQGRQTITAYEDRLNQLRLEVDRLHSRQYAQSGDVNLQLQELSQQQELLLEQQQLVKQLADRAAAMGIKVAASQPSSDSQLTPTASAPAAQKVDLVSLGQQMQYMVDENRLALAALNQTASQSTDEIVTALTTLGISAKLPDALPDGAGGPLLPATDSSDADSAVDQANAVLLALARFNAAQDAMRDAPIHAPLRSYNRISSGFGNRTDPFTGGRAFHSGIDFSAPYGSTVLSAGAGKVSFVGQRSGYGNLVEITHANGLVTRYGHLSSFLVSEGQVVDTGTAIARVGSTGRSTGPHLHFEVRHLDQAIDPGSYLLVGRRLARLLAAEV